MSELKLSVRDFKNSLRGICALWHLKANHLVSSLTRKQGSVVISSVVLYSTTNFNMLQCQRYKHMFWPLTIRAFNPTTGFQLLRSPKSGLIKEDLSHGSWWCHVDYPQIDTQTVLRAWASWLLNARSPTSLMQIANLARKQYTVENFLMNLSLMFVCLLFRKSS